MSKSIHLRIQRFIKYFFFFLLGITIPYFLLVFTIYINLWIPSIDFFLLYVLVIVILFFALVKIFSINSRKNQIKTFKYSVIYPHLFWIIIAMVTFTFNSFYDPTGGCNPPGPDGPNCHLCPKGTTGCEDIYKQD
ncbi:hypothetical protein CU304_09125 [Prochlorococcus marinus str. MU1415]|nr:hypothetical protein [Prochlorococcus marinus str. MU1415]